MRERGVCERGVYDEEQQREHRPVFNVSTLDNTHCLHMNDPALDMLLDLMDVIDLSQFEDKTARAMFHHLYNAGDRRPQWRSGR